MTSDTVFGHLALRFTAQCENLATEALAFILYSDAASTAFTQFVQNIIGVDPGNLSYETQRGGPEHAIPDITCIDQMGRRRVIVENKFWAGLTENQPVRYIDSLPTDVPSLMLFIVPNARRQLVWCEVISRCKNAKLPIGDVHENATRIAIAISKNRHLAVTTWSVLLEALSVAAASAGDTGCKNNIAQLQGLCKRMDEESFLPLSDEELTNLMMARRLSDFLSIPLEILQQAESEGICVNKGLRTAASRFGSGKYTQLGGVTAWVGLHANLWRKHRLSPIWVNFYPEYSMVAQVRQKLTKFRTATPCRCFDAAIQNYRWVAVPIFLLTGKEKTEVIRDAVRQLGELAQELTGEKLINEKETPETILEVGGEGGTISLYGSKNTAGSWVFWTTSDESMLAEMFDADDRPSLAELVSKSPVFYSLPEAFALLKDYPWIHLTPLRIHPEFRSAILDEVKRKGSPEEVADWTALACDDRPTST